MSDKVWIDLDDELEKLQDCSRYIYVDLGIQVVDPTEIVALSRELSPRKLKRLHMSVKENGWQDICPADLSLLKIPDGRYAVDDGGNHRAYISNELGIKEIKASVGTYIELDQMTVEELEKLNSYRLKRLELLKQLKPLKVIDKRMSIQKEISILNKEESD